MYKTSNEYVLREINGSFFLISSGKCTNRKWVYQLNEIGAKIWKLCGTCNCFQELIFLLEQNYNHHFTVAEEEEILAYINELEHNRLIMGENKW